MANTKRLLGIAIQAVNIFNELYENASASTSSNTVKNRDEGHAGTSIVIDCAITNKRIGLLLLDNVHDSFAIAVADKADYDAAAHTTLPISDLNLRTVFEYMESNFYK